MVRVGNSNKVIARNLLNNMRQDINVINGALEEQENNDNKLDATYVSTRNAVAIAAAEELAKKIEWYRTVQLALPAAVPYDDSGIDGIDINIRTFEDGNP